MAKPVIPAVTYFCVCGAAFHELDELKDHQREARHTPTVNYEQPRRYGPADALSPAALDDIPAGGDAHWSSPAPSRPYFTGPKPTESPADVPCCDNWPSNWPTDPGDVLLAALADRAAFDVDITLDPDDPFDAAVAEIVRINRRKRADYALDGGDVFSNFRQTSEVIAVDGFGPADAALFNVIQKVMRLRSLRANGRMDDPANEATADTYLDLAVYAIIALALSREA